MITNPPPTLERFARLEVSDSAKACRARKKERNGSDAVEQSSPLSQPGVGNAGCKNHSSTAMLTGWTLLAL
jgi:hypothetical protein